jgi:YesN/AraC family two-component response regulator
MKVLLIDNEIQIREGLKKIIELFNFNDIVLDEADGVQNGLKNSSV